MCDSFNTEMVRRITDDAAEEIDCNANIMEIMQNVVRRIQENKRTFGETLRQYLLEYVNGLTGEKPCGLTDEEPCGLADEEPCGLADEEPCGQQELRDAAGDFKENQSAANAKKLLGALIGMSERTAGNWLNSSEMDFYSEAHKETFFKLAFNLGLSGDRTEDMFMRLYRQPCFIRAPKELLYEYALNRGLTYKEAGELYKEYIERDQARPEPAPPADATGGDGLMSTRPGGDDLRRSLVDVINEATRDAVVTKLLELRPQFSTGNRSAWKNVRMFLKNLDFYNRSPHCVMNTQCFLVEERPFKWLCCLNRPLCIEKQVYVGVRDLCDRDYCRDGADLSGLTGGDNDDLMQSIGLLVRREFDAANEDADCAEFFGAANEDAARAKLFDAFDKIPDPSFIGENSFEDSPQTDRNVGLEKYEKLRTMLIFLHFQYFWAQPKFYTVTEGEGESSSYELPGYPSDDDAREAIEAYEMEITALLRECGFTKLYPMNIFDFIVLTCAKTGGPLATFSTLWVFSWYFKRRSEQLRGVEAPAEE